MSVRDFMKGMRKGTFCAFQVVEIGPNKGSLPDPCGRKLICLPAGDGDGSRAVMHPSG